MKAAKSQAAADVQADISAKNSTNKTNKDDVETTSVQQNTWDDWDDDDDDSDTAESVGQTLGEGQQAGKHDNNAKVGTATSVVDLGDWDESDEDENS